MDVRYGVEIGDNVIAFDDDGDGFYDDVHYSPDLGNGVRSFDNDGDGVYDDIAYVVSHNPTASSSKTVSPKNSSSSSGSVGAGLNITKKGLKKFLKGILILAAMGFISEVGLIIYFWLSH